MDNRQSSKELSSLHPIATSESYIQLNQPCDKTGEENLLQDIVDMLVRQTNRMENAITSNLKLTSRLEHLILEKLGP